MYRPPKPRVQTPVRDLCIEMYERGYSPTQIISLLGLTPEQVAQAIAPLDEYTVFNVLKMIGLHQKGADARTIAMRCNTNPAAVRRWLQAALSAGVQLPPIQNYLPTTSTASTGTTPPTSPPS